MAGSAQILIVCTGNICRSPYVERLLSRRLAQARPAADWPIEVTSAGTGALVGYPMEQRVAAALAAHGGDPSGFRARQLSAALVESADLVLTATRRHRGAVGKLVPAARRRVFTIRDFAQLVAGADSLYAGPPPSDARAWVARVAETAAARRGLAPPLSAAEADIVDPIGRDDEVVTAMTQQVGEALPTIVRVLAAER